MVFGHLYNKETNNMKLYTEEKSEIPIKLYTKEMFLKAAEKCEVSMIDAQHIMKYIDEYVTPIELPSNDEIQKEADGFYRLESYNTTFVLGAQWMRDKILNK